MNRHPDSLSQVFPSRQLVRGSALGALLWQLIAAVVLSGLLMVVVLATALLDSQGIALIRAGEQDQMEVQGQGFSAIAWKLRHHFWSAAVRLSGQWLPGTESVSSTLFLLITASLGLGVLLSLASAVSQKYAGRTAGRIAGQLREAIHRHALRMGISDLLNDQLVGVLSMFSTEITELEHSLIRWLRGLFRGASFLVVGAVVALLIDWMVAFECIVPSLACWLLIRRQRERHRRTQLLHEDQAASELKLLEEGIRSSRLIAGYHLEKLEQDRFSRHLSRYQAHLSQVERLQGRRQRLSWLLGLICWSLVFFLVGSRLLLPASDQQHLTLADAAGLLSCFLLGWFSLESLSDAAAGRNRAAAVADRVNRYLKTFPEVGQAVGAKFLQPLNRAIEFENVCWMAGSRKILDGLCLKIPAGGSTAIVAFDPLEPRVLMSLLPRFIEPLSGRVLIDGQDLNLVTLESLRTETLTVSGSEAWLTGTVHENISGGDPRYSLTQVTEAAKQAHAHQFIQKLPQGYETVIGEHGEQLDLSQSFRLALARALLRDPAVLIVDEPGGDMSEDSKALIEDACRRAMRDRTVLYLPNRLSTLRAVDRIILLNRGRLEVIGTHEVLLETSALYRHWEYLRFNEFRHGTTLADSGLSGRS